MKKFIQEFIVTIVILVTLFLAFVVTREGESVAKKLEEVYVSIVNYFFPEDVGQPIPAKDSLKK